MPRTYSERKGTKTDQALAAMPPERLTPMSVEWWVTEAEKIRGECPRCKGHVRSQYIAPKSLMGECGIVSTCAMCGWERLVMHGRWGVPYGGANGI